jgi:cysteine desulfurase
MAVYLDCAATTPVDPRVAELAARFLTADFGNAGSRTHDMGRTARRAVERARDQVAAAVGAARGEVVFTSGATESNNLAILGLAEHGLRTGKKHLVSTRIEHHAVLEPLEALRSRGFELTLVAPNRGGWVEPGAVRTAVRPDTLLVSVMHVNNETGVVQPVEDIAAALRGQEAYFHVDAAQSFGRILQPLREPRIDLISVSGHKVHAPKGVGALVARRRGTDRPPLRPIMFGGGQELGLRPGTLPVHLVAALGLAAELAVAEAEPRADACRRFRVRMLDALAPLDPVLAGDLERAAPHIVNLSFPGLDSDEVIDALTDHVAVSSGAACTSQSYTCSHVLSSMGLDEPQLSGALRFSWCHRTPDVDWTPIVAAVRRLREMS